MLGLVSDGPLQPPNLQRRDRRGPSVAVMSAEVAALDGVFTVTKDLVDRFGPEGVLACARTRRLPTARYAALPVTRTDGALDRTALDLEARLQRRRQGLRLRGPDLRLALGLRCASANTPQPDSMSYQGVTSNENPAGTFEPSPPPHHTERFQPKSDPRSTSAGRHRGRRRCHLRPCSQEDL